MVYTHYTRVYHYRLWYNLYVMNVRGGKSRRRTERFVKRGRQTDSWWSDCDIRWTAASWAEAMWVRDCADRGSGTQRPRRFLSKNLQAAAGWDGEPTNAPIYRRNCTEECNLRLAVGVFSLLSVVIGATVARPLDKRSTMERANA